MPWGFRQKIRGTFLGFGFRVSDYAGDLRGVQGFGFLKVRDTFLWVPIIRIIAFWRSMLGPPYLWKLPLRLAAQPEGRWTGQSRVVPGIGFKTSQAWDLGGGVLNAVRSPEKGSNLEFVAGLSCSGFGE